MKHPVVTQNCQCACGETKFTLTGQPIVRLLCHCTICQEYSRASYSDITLFRAKDVHLENKETIHFKKYKKPPAVNRGKCRSCDQPAIEFFNFSAFPFLAIIPSQNVQTEEFLPEPAAHIFYHRRVADIEDKFPKHSGYVKSQMAMLGAIFRGF